MTFHKKWDKQMGVTRPIPESFQEDVKGLSKLEAVRFLTKYFCEQAAEAIYNEQDKKIRLMKKRADKAEFLLEEQFNK